MARTKSHRRLRAASQGPLHEEERATSATEGRLGPMRGAEDASMEFPPCQPAETVDEIRRALVVCSQYDDVLDGLQATLPGADAVLLRDREDLGRGMASVHVATAVLIASELRGMTGTEVLRRVQYRWPGVHTIWVDRYAPLQAPSTVPGGWAIGAGPPFDDDLARLVQLARRAHAEGRARRKLEVELGCELARRLGLADRGALVCVLLSHGIGDEIPNVMGYKSRDAFRAYCSRYIYKRTGARSVNHLLQLMRSLERERSCSREMPPESRTPSSGRVGMGRST